MYPRSSPHQCEEHKPGAYALKLPTGGDPREPNGRICSEKDTPENHDTYSKTSGPPGRFPREVPSGPVAQDNLFSDRRDLSPDTLNRFAHSYMLNVTTDSHL